ncbi:hypothetical protein CHLNCDRAFT_134848 [Chlorella variabilis]|uniref:Essential protein Yae1 N-terminal domain-containing protein n=1 Tax=Chlorella variabilis TaxID=554065 RepID=E1ZGY0_CHLVA|nr:hypothetical protein CHLNCDRAFT_134848 [Chlorella variabilis]EFN54830.1 hypothetical protein CHLNCDRAFT_134848 [Chlorella variabilis]|eukprot:XP_005846932.1 hypothetical protein CHLNCDRAFT_134848 [Chlorella variabilis]
MAMIGRADHIWGADDGEEEPGHEQLDREWRARREEHFSGGYREGLEAGKHETVQEGFDEGYRLGAAAGFECGAARGAAATLRALAPRLPADLRSRLQEVEQEQGQGGQQLADMPYQQLQQQPCDG